MTEDYAEATEVEMPPDPRIIAMHRVVDLEKEHERAQHEADRRAKQVAILSDELRAARDELGGLLGYPSNSGNVKAMDLETARKIAREYR